MRELRYDRDGGLDDVAIENVEMFRLERMDKNAWWACVYLEDGKRITFWLQYSRKDGLTASADEDLACCDEIGSEGIISERQSG